MENASKALIIAGSVLIAMAIIFMAVKLTGEGQGTLDSEEQTMQATEVATFNNKFTVYFGNNISASKVKALANVVVSNNATSNRKVSISFDNGSTSCDDASDITSGASNLSGKYTVSAGSFSAEGYVTSIICGKVP